MNTKIAKHIIRSYFPCFDYLRVYSEPRSSGQVIKFWCSKCITESVPAYRLMADELRRGGALSVEMVYNPRGGVDLLLSV